MAEDLGERTEAPTSRRLSQARSEGQIARSSDLGASIDLIGALLVLVFLGSWLIKGLAELVRHLLDAHSSGQLLILSDAQPILWWTFKQALLVAVPFLGLMFVVSYFAQFLQVGWLLTLKPLQPKFDRLNPISGAKRIISRKNLIKTILNLVKLVIMCAIAYAIIRRNMDAIATIPMLDVLPAFALMGKIIMDLCIWLLFVMLIIGLADFAYQRWQHIEDLKMTKQQVKDEFRSMEGDMETKGRRLRLARQMALQRVNQTVPKADVVITNPTHYSVALKYESGKMAAPTVVAKGVDDMAFRIREIAAIHRVPIIEKPPLARALYAAVPIGKQISPEFFEAVAEVLAYVYRLENRKVG